MALKKVSVTVMLLIVIQCLSIPVSAAGTRAGPDAVLIDIESIDHMVNRTMKKSGVPGMAVMIVHGDRTYTLNYGFSDMESRSEVGAGTLFELGSLSKSFTALAILDLEQKGLLKTDDPVTDYIPWFKPVYSGTYNNRAVDDATDISISHLLHHTSGLPANAVAFMESGESDGALEETVRQFSGTALTSYPSEKFVYSSLNYDILGFIIQTVSGQSYEEYIRGEILSPLGLNNTYLSQSDANSTGNLAKGYKRVLLKARLYNAPRFRGNTPAGYIISGQNDMEAWLRLQMGLLPAAGDMPRLIDKSHDPDTTVSSENSAFYAAGWQVGVNRERIWHSGSTPNYSSMMIVQPDDEIGVCVLANMNSNAAE
ncbi:MAG: beta-lactamase family protein, partial [Oscillospiraceae bacterium]|nr:beta-lactamase family protein [Oscillospiraceae bacterium]